MNKLACIKQLKSNAYITHIEGNRSINIKAQHKTRRAAITQIYFKQHLLQKS